MHESLELLEAEAVEFLLVPDRAQRHDAERRGLTTGEERGPVGSRQDAHFTADRSDLGRLAAVGAQTLVKDLGAHALFDFGLEALGQVRQPVRERWPQLGDRLLLEVVERRL